MEGKKVKVPDEPSSEVCDLCGRPMVIKVGKYGKFLACSGFPECRGTKRWSRIPAASAPSAAKAVCWSAKAPRAASIMAASATRTATYDMGHAGAHQVPQVRQHHVPQRLQAVLRKGSCGYEMPVPKKD